MKKKLLASVLLAASLVTLGAVSAARAEPLPAGTTILETVDSATTLLTSIATGDSILRVEGVVQGESQAREFDLNVYQPNAHSQEMEERCLKFMLLLQTHPGRYTLALATSSGYLTGCKLKSR